jgi:predicted RecB family nuclease
VFEPPRAVDLYGDVVLKATEWPTRDHSIKTLAKYLGFTWRAVARRGSCSMAFEALPPSPGRQAVSHIRRKS